MRILEFHIYVNLEEGLQKHPNDHEVAQGFIHREKQTNKHQDTEMQTEKECATRTEQIAGQLQIGRDLQRTSIVNVRRVVQ